MHRLKLFLITLTLVAGCATGSGTTNTPAQAVFAAEGAYAAALTVAVAYGKLPRCPAATICSQQKVVDQIKLADGVAHAAIFSAQHIVRTQGFGQDAIASAVATATEAAKALSLITATLQVK